MGKNIQSSNHYGQANIHPHVNANGRPCLAGYNSMVIESIQNRKWIKFATITSDFLTQYNPQSPFVKI